MRDVARSGQVTDAYQLLFEKTERKKHCGGHAGHGGRN